MKRYAQGSLPIRRRQRGVTLFIALIVLVAMTMAAVAMMRSVDTSTVVAGNIGFRQSAVNAADQGVQTAFAWLGATVTTQQSPATTRRTAIFRASAQARRRTGTPTPPAG